MTYQLISHNCFLFLIYTVVHNGTGEYRRKKIILQRNYTKILIATNPTEVLIPTDKVVEIIQRVGMIKSDENYKKTRGGLVYFTQVHILKK